MFTNESTTAVMAPCPPSRSNSDGPAAASAGAGAGAALPPLREHPPTTIAATTNAAR
jgi:hypothetical protein